MMTHVSLPLPNDGYFFARSETVGTSDAELHATMRGEISDVRSAQIARNAVAALEQLKNAEPRGRC